MTCADLAQVAVCGACGEPGDLVWVQFYRRPDGWFCRDTVACYGRDWPEEIPEHRQAQGGAL